MIVFQPFLKKQAEGVGPSSGLTLPALKIPSIGILKMSACLLSPWSFPVAHHQSQQAKFRPLSSWSLARGLPPSEQRSQEGGGQVSVQGKGYRPQKAFWVWESWCPCKPLQSTPQPVTGVESGPVHNQGWVSQGPQDSTCGKHHDRKH